MVKLTLSALPSASVTVTGTSMGWPLATVRFCCGVTSGGRLAFSTWMGTVMLVDSGVPVPSPLSVAVTTML